MIIPRQRTCSHCGERFERTFFGINLITTRYERCPHCRKWGRQRRFGIDTEEPPIIMEARTDREESAEDRLRRRIEESRFEEP